MPVETAQVVVDHACSRCYSEYMLFESAFHQA